MSKKTLNTVNLEALGAERLASLLIEVSTGSADIKRRLRLELSHNLGSAELAHDVRKRLAQLRKSTSYVGWRKRKALIKDLDTQVSMIIDKIAHEDPTAAFDLLWEFIGLAPFIYGRVDDSRGDVGDVFRGAILQLEDVAPRALLDLDALADRVWSAIEDNGYGEWDGIICVMAPSLGTAGLARLKAHIDAYAEAPLEAETQDHDAIQFLRQLRGGGNYAADRKAQFVKRYLQEIAIASDDTQAFVAQYSEANLKRQDISAQVAMLHLDDGNATAALDILRNAEQNDRGLGRVAWDAAYIATLVALGRDAQAQAHRWSCFKANLDGTHLRAHLKELPDFEDVEAEERAMTYALEFSDASTALNFLINWPDLRRAATLIQTRTNDFNGDHNALLTPAAEALRARHPLAAVILWRRMIDATLGAANASRYGLAADHVSDCASLDAVIDDYGAVPDHQQYLLGLKSQHERKTSFWTKLK